MTTTNRPYAVVAITLRIARTDRERTHGIATDSLRDVRAIAADRWGMLDPRTVVDRADAESLTITVTDRGMDR